MGGLVKIPAERPKLKEKNDELKVDVAVKEAKSNIMKTLKTKLKLNGGVNWKIKVSLSGKRNLKTLRNWMVKHMEAYPETKNGFIVQFIDDSRYKLYEVKVCNKDEKPDITINGTDYKIFKRTIRTSKTEATAEDKKADIKNEFHYPTTDK